MLTKNGGGDHKRRLSRVHYICTMHCVQCTLEKQCTAHHVIKYDISLYETTIFSCHQAAIWLVQCACLSVCPSVTPFSPCCNAKGQGQRSKVKVTEVNTQLNCFRTVTPVWIHIWWWNDAYSLMMLRRGALLFFKVIRQISRSHGSKKLQIWPRLGVSGL